METGTFKNCDKKEMKIVTKQEKCKVTLKNK
jgi:hypothetical protein